MEEKKITKTFEATNCSGADLGTYTGIEELEAFLISNRCEYDLSALESMADGDTITCTVDNPDNLDYVSDIDVKCFCN